jgi:hypothetical protein
VGQGDVSTTRAYDFPEFSVNSDGLLPNNRTHQIKLFGYVQATPQLGIGGNLLAATGRPKNCIGNAPVAVNAGDYFGSPSQVTNYSGYGSSYFFCNGVASPRGSLGNLPTDIRVDMNFIYKPESIKGLAFKVDIFNLFNTQVAESINESRYNNNATTTRNAYSSVLSYSTPRNVKLSASYDYKF